MFLNQGTSQPEASQEEEKVNGDIIDMEFVEELDDVQLATVVGGLKGYAGAVAITVVKGYAGAVAVTAPDPI